MTTLVLLLAMTGQCPNGQCTVQRSKTVNVQKTTESRTVKRERRGLRFRLFGRKGCC